MKVKKAKIKTATMWSILTEVIAKCIAPITTMILARTIDIESFGILASITMIISLADNIINIGFQRLIIQLDSKNELEVEEYCNICFWSNFILSLLCWGIIILFRNDITLILEIPNKNIEIILAGSILPISAFSTVYESLYMKKLEFKILFYNRLISVFIPLIVTLPIAFITKNYWALLIGNISLAAGKSFFLTLISNWKPKLYFSLFKLKQIFKLVLENMLDALIYWSSSWFDILFINKLFGVYYSGIYKTSQSLVTSIISLLTAGVIRVLFSSLSFYKNDKEKFREIFLKFQKGTSILAIPLGIGIYMYREFIVLILLGNKWLIASDFVGIWGFIITLISTYSTFSREAYRAIQKVNISLIIQILHLIFIISICILCRNLDFNNFIFIRSICYLQIIFLHSIFMKKLFNISFFEMLKNTLYPIICSIIMGIVAIFLKSIIKEVNLQIFSIFICVTIYFLCLMLSKEYRKTIYLFIREKGEER